MGRMCISILLLFTCFTLSSKFVNANESQTNEYTKIVHEFLPSNSELVEPEEPSDSPIQQYDFDQDGQNELIVTYRIKGEPNRLKAIMVKKDKGQWKKVWKIDGEGHAIHYSGFVDITGDGVKEYLIGWMIGASAGNELEIYQWQDSTLKQIVDYAYHKLEFIKKGNQTSLVIWNRFCCDAYTVEVLKWDGKQLVADNKLYASYYPNIKKFYEKKIKEMDAWFYWYALADAQIKANLLDEARLSIQKGLSFNLEKKMFMELQRKLQEKTN
jgi:hypothetical protein